MIEEDPIKRVLTEVSVLYHSQLPLSYFDPKTIIDVKIFKFSEQGRDASEVLDREIGIWAKSFAGDITDRRVVAALSMDAAVALRDNLARALGIQSVEQLADYPKYSYPMICTWKEEDFKGAVSIGDHQVNVNDNQVVLNAAGYLLVFPYPEELNLLHGLFRALPVVTTITPAEVNYKRQYQPRKLQTKLAS